MATRAPQQLWQAALGELELLVARPSYETFLQGTIALELKGGSLVVGTASSFVAEYLEKRLYATIERTVTKLAGGPLMIQFKSPAGRDTTSDFPNNGTQAQRAPEAAQQRLLASSELHAQYSFANFIVGPSNALSHAAAIAAARHPGAKYNPLFIYSDVGLGKTHLLQAIALDLRSRGRTAIYQTSQQFTNAFIDAIREGRMPAFRERYLATDALLIDDIQFLCGKEQTQEEFFHLFNGLYQAGRQVVLSCDRPPFTLSPLTERLRSRFASGLTTDMHPPPRETREAILRAMAVRRGDQMPEAVISRLSEPESPSVRELESRFLRVVAWAELTGHPLSSDVATQALTATPLSRDLPPPEAKTVLAAIAEHFRIPVSELIGRARDRSTTRARSVTMYLLWESSRLSPTIIAREMGDRDPSAVHQAHRLIAARLSVDAHLKREIMALASRLKQAPAD